MDVISCGCKDRFIKYVVHNILRDYDTRKYKPMGIAIYLGFLDESIVTLVVDIVKLRLAGVASVEKAGEGQACSVYIYRQWQLENLLTAGMG